MKETAYMVEQSLRKLDRWVIDHEYRGYEPFDGLSSVLRPLTFRNVLAERILQQTIRQSPVNLRPLFGVKPLDSTKGRGYMAWGYLLLLQGSNDAEYRKKAIACLEWLMENKSPLYQDYSWGNHFDYSSRGGQMPRHEPTIVWTSLIGNTFLDAYEILKDERYLNVARSVCDWILSLPRDVNGTGTCLSYVKYQTSSIHNSNMLGAAMLARTASLTGDRSALPLAKEAMRYSCADQLPDGAWYYGKKEKFHWIDNFHTGYNLDSLKRYIAFTGEREFEENLRRGYRYFKENFFEESGRPKYYHDRAYPIDIQCAAQAIDTLVLFSDEDPSSVELARRVARWTISNMQDASGYFYYRILPLKKVKIPMIHWGQATMFKALAHLLTKLRGLDRDRENDPAGARDGRARGVPDREMTAKAR
jgi:rhamnogalacturonyl hydrolase YesR